MRKTLIVIEPEDAKVYAETLRAIRKRLLISFENSDDLSFRKWINKHGVVIDDLLEELRLRG